MSHEKLLVKKILEQPELYEWSLQGFGMLRTYLAPEVRLHVWDSRYAVDQVTTLHTHPWHLRSQIVAGELVNVRYELLPEGDTEHDRYVEQEILCGPGGHATDRQSLVQLRPYQPEHYVEGDEYTQEALEIHESQSADGTVTIIERTFLEDTEHAYVYVPKGKEWISAEPRSAKRSEVFDICQHSLARWFS
jgi:hypothetical protein